MPRTALTFPRRKTVENMLTNGDFEYAPPFTAATNTVGRWIDGTAAGSITDSKYKWAHYAVDTGGYMQFDNTQYKTGNYSLKLTKQSAGGFVTAGTMRADGLLYAQESGIPALPLTIYTVGYWMKTEYISGSALSGASVRVSEYDGKGGRITVNAISVTQVNTTTDWTYYSASFTTLTTTRYLNIRPSIVVNDGSANLNMNAWFDDITLVKSPIQTRNVPTKLTLSEPSENLLYNSDFESAPTFTAATTTTARWIDGTAGGSLTNTYGWLTSFNNSCSVQFDTTEKFSGTSSMKVSTTGANAAAQVISTVLPTSSSTSYIDILPNTQYRVTFKMKTNLISGDSRGAFLRFSQFDSAKTASLGVDSTYVKTTTDWTTYTITFVTSPVAYYGQIKLFVYAQDAPATLLMDAWFDDIQVIKLIPPRKTPDNLLSNGNFEYAPPFTAAQTSSGWIDGTAGGSLSTGYQYGWGLNRSGTATAQYDSTEKKFGTNSLKLSTLAVASYAEVNKYGSTSAPYYKASVIPALPNTTYTVTWWMKTNYVSGDSSQGATVGFIEWNGAFSATTFNSGPGATIKTTTDWTQYSFTVTTASTTRFVNVQPRIYGHTGTATLIMDAWFDDITLTKTYPVKSTRSLVDNTVIYNGNFEYVPTGTIATTSGSAWIDGTAAGVTNKGEFGWVIFNYVGSWAAKFDTTEKYSGTASMKISTTAVSSTIGVSNQEGTALSNQINNMPIAPNTSYTLSFKMKTLVNSGSATTGAYLNVSGCKVDGFSAASGFTGTTVSTKVNTTTGWTDYSITFTTASTAYYLRPELRITGNDGTGTLIMDAWFDDITLVKN